jgi:branched-chain amino acid transport system permease protein
MPPDILINSLVNSSMIVLMAMGLVLVFSIMGILNFAHGQFYMMGAFMLFCFFNLLGITYIISLMLAALAMALLGVAMERYVMRPIGQPLQIVVATIAMIQLFEGIVVLIFGPRPKSVTPAFTGSTIIGGISIPNERIAIVIIAVVLIISLYLFLQKTRYGLAIRAAAQQPVAAGLFGIRASRVSSLVMALGCGLAALAGGIMAPIFYIDPWMGSSPLTYALLAIVIGGMGSLLGAAIGGIILGIIGSVGAYYLGFWATLVALGIVIVILLIRPQGLFGFSEK